jgi:hypothetical protein
MIAREHSAAKSAIFLLFTVVLFCCDSREVLPWFGLGVKQKKCVRVTVIAKKLWLHDVYVGIRSSISARYNKSPYPSAASLRLYLVAPVKQLPLLLLLQGSHVAAVTAEGDDIISAFAELPSGSTSFYSTHYSGQGCNNSTSSSSFVSLRGS